MQCKKELPSLLEKFFFCAAIHWNARDDRDEECLRHTKYGGKARSATGIGIEAALAFAVIRIYRNL